MLERPAERFNEHFIHEYAGDTLPLRTLARLLYDQEHGTWTIHTAWFDIEFSADFHTAAYTLFLKSDEGVTDRLVIPATPVSDQFLFEQRGESLQNVDHEWRRAAYYLWMNLHSISFDSSEKAVDRGLFRFLDDRAQELEYDHLTTRLTSLSFPKRDDSSSVTDVIKVIGELYDHTMELVHQAADCPEEVVNSIGARQILDIWTDLRWYDPYWRVEGE